MEEPLLSGRIQILCPLIMIYLAMYLIEFVLIFLVLLMGLLVCGHLLKNEELKWERKRVKTGARTSTWVELAPCFPPLRWLELKLASTRLDRLPRFLIPTHLPFIVLWLVLLSPILMVHVCASMFDHYAVSDLDFEF